jgi:hypothetical protein
MPAVELQIIISKFHKIQDVKSDAESPTTVGMSIVCYYSRYNWSI